MGRLAAAVLATALIGATAVAPSYGAHQAAGPPTSLAVSYSAPEPIAAPAVFRATPAARHVTSGSSPTNPSWFADVTKPRINQTITFTGFASDPDDDIATYAWNWGDGNTTAPSASDQATHAYATAGTYTVRLTVTDATALSVAYENTITVRNNWAPESVSGYPDSTADAYPRRRHGGPFDFYGDDPEDSNRRRPHVGRRLGRRDRPRHGDGSPHVTQISHTWSTPGTYVIHYSATDSDGTGGGNPNKTTFGAPILVTVAANPAPQKRLLEHRRRLRQRSTRRSPSPASRRTPTAAASRKYEWDFNGDGVYEGADLGQPTFPGTSQITHQFSQPGTYAVGLRVTDSDPPGGVGAGASTTYVSTFIVTNPANGPYGYLYSRHRLRLLRLQRRRSTSRSASPPAVFDPNGAVHGTQYVFHWGDGTADTSTASPDTVHTYTSPGDYRPSVTITLSNAQVITVQYTAYTSTATSNPYGSYTYGVLHVVDNAPPAYAYAYVTNNTGCLHPNTSIDFTLYGFDPDGGHIASFDVDWNADGTFDTTAIPADRRHRDRQPHVHGRRHLPRRRPRARRRLADQDD